MGDVMPAALASPRRRRALLAAGLSLLALLWLGRSLSSVLTAPDVAAVCDHVLELAELAGESPGASEREACEQHYTQLRARRGLFGWARLAWCVNGAKNIPDAGGC